MRVLVLGGTRFIGPRTIERLLARGHDVAVYNRGNSTGELDRSVKRYKGDRLDVEELRRSILEFEPVAVLDLCSYFVAHQAAFVEATEGRTLRHVLVSSCDVYRNYGGLLGKEEEPPDPAPLTEVSPLRTKLYPYRGEEFARDGFEDYDKIPIEGDVLARSGVVARLPMVYGPGDGQHRVRQYLRRLDAGRKEVLLGEREAGWMTCRAHVRQVARALTLLVDDGVEGEVYNVGELDALTEREWVLAVASAGRKSAEVVTVPDALVAGIEGHVERPDWHLSVDTTKIRQLGFQEDESFEAGMLETVAWERENPGDPVRGDEFTAEDRLLADMV